MLTIVALLGLLITCLIQPIRSAVLTIPSTNARRVCHGAYIFCSPLPNDIWYHNNQYDFIWNDNNTFFKTTNINNNINFDLHILTTATIDNIERRTLKSWFNLTNANSNSFSVKVTDDWFPAPLPSISNTSDGASNFLNGNKTWTTVAFLKSRDGNFNEYDPTLSGSNILLNPNNYVQFQLVQSTPTPLSLSSAEVLSQKWVLAIIISSIGVVVVTISVMIWLVSRMKKQKRLSRQQSLLYQDKQHEDSQRQLYGDQKEQEPPAPPQHQQQQVTDIGSTDYFNTKSVTYDGEVYRSRNLAPIKNSSFLSTPEAKLIADKFRQVMSSPSEEDGEDEDDDYNTTTSSSGVANSGKNSPVEEEKDEAAVAVNRRRQSKASASKS